MVFHLFLRFTPLPIEKLRGDYSAAYLASDGSLLRLTLSPSGKYRLPLELSEVSPQVVNGFLVYEDRWFRWHPGINPVSVLRALFLNLSRGRVVSGASTLTMQVAKLLDRKPRTLWAKLLETFRALQLEARFSKDEILGFYLNSVPMGGNIEGVGAASLLYFGKPAKTLSWGEAALLISLPRSPAARRPDRFPEKAREGRDRVLKAILPVLKPPPLESEEAYRSILPKGRFANPNPAPHLVRRAAGILGRAKGVVSLCLKPNFQGMAQMRLSAAVEALKNRGVYNGSLLILDNRTMEVLAYVGSPDMAEPRGGQINGCNILRSPGSALKPFLYALSLDRGLITPKHVLFDIPRDYTGYKPANYEGRYDGLVAAEDALAGSLNVPAVGLEASLEGEGGGLASWIKGAGCVGRGRSRMVPGLSVVLGTYPVSMEEIVRLYAALANGGRMRQLRFLLEEGDAQEKGKPLISPEGSYLISEMLAKVERTDLPASWEFSPTRGKVAFKTGTSFGFRDAWCVGYNPEYTVGVWLGNADNSGSHALRGHDVAAPVVIEIFNSLTKSKDPWFKRPPGVGVRMVCALSGDPAGEECGDPIEDEFIPGVSSMAPCPAHRRVPVRKKDGREMCRFCMTGKPGEYASRVFEVWPPDVTRFLRGRGQRFEPVPRHNPDCSEFNAANAPRITSPAKGGRYEMRPSLPPEGQRIGFSVQTGPDVREVYWFLNGKFVGEGKPDRTHPWDPVPGKWEVSVVDSRGRADKASFLVFEKAGPPPLAGSPAGEPPPRGGPTPP